ncbi:MAG: hypothetical protein WBD42_07395 [Methylovirgula sp.]
MNETTRPQAGNERSLRSLWEKYEDIAMHFNDLLIRLRTQALGGVAALATVAGIFAKSNIFGVRDSWEIATIVFFGLTVFWIAIWLLDFCYYNRLLIGAVVAIIELEKESDNPEFSRINLSTRVEEAVEGRLPTSTKTCRQRLNLEFGRWAFYILVFAFLSLCTCLAYYKMTSAENGVPTPPFYVSSP